MNLFSKFFGSNAHPLAGHLSSAEISRLHAALDLANIGSAENVELMSGLTVEQREFFARETSTPVLYFGEEVGAVMAAEETAALKAAPAGHKLENLNGLNIGCGARTISPFVLPVDIMREAANVYGEHSALTANALLALSDDLPFKPASLDYIIALHMLEHVEDPVGVINYWLSLLKPGGGIGIVVPDWRYTWDARNDNAPLGHKWNPTPDLVRSLYDLHWSGGAHLEALDSYPFRISFDFVLRKHGEFEPFKLPPLDCMLSGHQRHMQGLFMHGE